VLDILFSSQQELHLPPVFQRDPNVHPSPLLEQLISQLARQQEQHFERLGKELYNQHFSPLGLVI